MFALTVQTVLLLAIAFILGCIVGSLLRYLFGSAAKEASSHGAATGVGAATASLADTTPSPKAAEQSALTRKTPAVPKPPMPQAPIVPAEPVAPASKPVAAKPVLVKETKPVEKPKPAPTPSAKARNTDTPAKKAPPTKMPAGKPDNLKLIKGIGPQNESRLNGLGVRQFAQIAGWSKKDQAHYGDVLAFPGRIEREEWVKQAKVLAKGGSTEFAKRVKSGSVDSSLGTAAKVDAGTKPKNMLKAARNDKADDLTAIDGVGAAIEKKMFKLGIFHFDQIAGMSKAEQAWLGNAIGFPGRPERENWAGEAKDLTTGAPATPAKKATKGQIRAKRKS